uniref:transient receptor potential cation channel subfamily A member 1 homolog isoform X1 n=1 Tax=Ciona intestinalis TaxID=7719 RepID=UPI00089DD4A8|nr:transient receptor potential cation channel subfamily A member 1 homolog isoform X1 [Ciona intestinalis]XP_018668343.1 transient receptor potential cation channel subfamily A member 1 homolog isoform X1 [Ciona intestinalis]XP_026691370.1 transient receptor potential cation channel subfamily A member 1 homolog isoform X1 [Ciona intestinalis]XP_026691371.1 transient receptor potential cation channel subfamily A member 1 homolog isoform X1 [Ciona intestinalis]XP_026691372.1 transient receptor p|eukprot:XP_018668342.1 transient receptor potential cation channel subfamily A member 1 homolog isoform X1 [Ciona intestinalis]
MERESIITTTDNDVLMNEIRNCENISQDEEILRECVLKAVNNNDVESVRKLLENKISSAIWRYESKKSIFLESIKHCNEEMWEILLKHGANIDQRDEYNVTALHLASQKGNTQTVKFLLRHKCSIDIADLHHQQTALHYATTTNGCTETIKLLLDKGCDVSKADNRGLSPLMFAIRIKACNAVDAFLSHHRWWESMCQSTFDMKTNRMITPFREMIRWMPHKAKEVMDRCVSVQKCSDADDPKFTVKYKLILVDDTYLSEHWKLEGRETNEDVVVNANNVTPADSHLQCGDCYDCGKDSCLLKKDATPYTSDNYILRENHVINLIRKSGRPELIMHPLTVAAVQYKWKLFFKVVGLPFTCIYFLFLTLLNMFIIGQVYYEERPQVIYHQWQSNVATVLLVLASGMLLYVIRRIFTMRLEFITHGENYITVAMVSLAFYVIITWMMVEKMEV